LDDVKWYKHILICNKVAYFAIVAFYCICFAEQSNNEKDTLQKSVETLREEHSTADEKLHEELTQKLQTAAEQHEVKLQAEINRGMRLYTYLLSVE